MGSILDYQNAPPVPATNRMRLRRKPSGQFVRGEREKAMDLIIQHIEAAARAGEPSPSSRQMRRAIGIGDKSMERYLLEMRRTGRISWRIMYDHQGWQRRIVTVHASGLMTAVPQPPAPPPKKPKANGSLMLQGRPSALGIPDRAIYGPIDYAVKTLRHRGYIVFKDGPGVRVGNKLMQPWQVEQLAARERRLMVAI